jgi:hypothetical protein
MVPHVGRRADMATDGLVGILHPVLRPDPPRLVALRRQRTVLGVWTWVSVIAQRVVGRSAGWGYGMAARGVDGP